MKISVLCYSEAGVQRPYAFQLGGRRVPVVDVLGQWEAQEHRYFRVRDFDGRRFILRHCQRSDCWELQGVCGPAKSRVSASKGARAAA
jgi:hypothetical protein